MTLVLFALGVVLLIAGAQALVRGASGLAAALGVSPLVIGLTVVAWGTSAPEVAVSVDAAVRGSGDIAVGNVVGSNIMNVLLILGLSALVAPLVVARAMSRVHVPLMIGASILLVALAVDGRVGRIDAAVLLVGFAAYTAYSMRSSRGGEAPRPVGKRRPALDVAFVIAGLGLLVLGARWLVNGAVAFAQALGVSELVIGLTIVAAGTSLPEIATSVVATLKGERDIAVGNVVGSCIFNIVGVLGVSGLAAPDGIAVSGAVLRFDLPVMVAAAVVCLPVFLSGSIISRAEGALFLACYAGYTACCVTGAAPVTPVIGVTAAAILWGIARLLIGSGPRPARASGEGRSPSSLP